MNVLIVGGAGYLGSVLCGELLRHGFKVRVLDCLLFGKQGLDHLDGNLELVVADMRDETAVRQALQGVGAVINVGGLSNDPTAEFKPDLNMQLNCEASIAIARIAREMGVGEYLYASSCSVYDDGTGEVVHTEEDTAQPKATYAISKLKAEQALLSLNWNVKIFRFGTLFGVSPRMRYDLVINTMARAAAAKGEIVLHANGKVWRPLTHVNDAAQAIVFTIVNLPRGVYNVVYENARVSELALQTQRMAAAIGMRVEIRCEDTPVTRNYRASNKKLLGHGFACALSPESGILQVLRHIKGKDIASLFHPRYENIAWLKLREEMEGKVL
jgi:nucleoside-diphosphate-sugar epimerase